MSELRFRSISEEQTDRISPNFVYAFMLTTMLTHEQLWPLIDIMILFLLNIFRTWVFLQHEKCCSGAIVRFFDNSSLNYIWDIYYIWDIWGLD